MQLPGPRSRVKAESSASWPCRPWPPHLLDFIAQGWPCSLPLWLSSLPTQPHAGSHLLLSLSFPSSNSQDFRMFWLLSITLAQTLPSWWVKRRLACGVQSSVPCSPQRDSWPGSPPPRTTHESAATGKSSACSSACVTWNQNRERFPPLGTLVFQNP